jgi:hypothetical protein
MDRMEGLLEMLIENHVKFADEHNKLLTSQILLTDSLSRHIKETGQHIKDLADSQKATEGRMTILIAMFDTFIGEKGPQQ